MKLKFRGIASFEERAQLHFDALKVRAYAKRSRVDNWLLRQARYLSPGEYRFLDKTWRPIKVGETWGGEDTTGFFKQRIRIPREFAVQKVVLQIFLGGDSLVSINRVPWHSMDIFRNEFPLTGKVKPGEVFDLQIESYMNFQGVSAKTNELLASDLVVIDQDLHDAYWDLWCVAKLLQITDSIQCALGCFDRLLFKGYLPISRPARMERWLASRGLLLKDFKDFVTTRSDRLKTHAQQLAAKAGRPYQYLSRPIRKDDEARQIAARDGLTEGLICVFATRMSTLLHLQTQPLPLPELKLAA